MQYITGRLTSYRGLLELATAHPFDPKTYHVEEEKFGSQSGALVSCTRRRDT